MSAWFTLWFALAGLIGLIWLIRYASTGRILRRRCVLSSRSYPGPPANAERHGQSVSIIVAAKDEEDNIEACVRGLLDQDYPNYKLIVVDDRSRDRTPTILQRLEQEAGSHHKTDFRVITVKTLRDGWFGKNNAMREGVAASDGAWLLFTDSDCRQTSRRTISMAMREAAAYEADFLSVTPVLETHALWERIIQPVCSIVLMIWFLPHRVNKPEHKTAYANGAFMLMRRSCYDAIGGHERVRTEVNEDIHMARLTKRIGLRLRVVENDDLYRTRMYGSFGAAWRGWSRIFYGCLGSLPRLSAAAFLLVLLSFVPWVSLVTALVGMFSSGARGESWALALSVWLGVIALMQLVMWRAYAILRAGPIWSLTYAFGAFVTLGMLINATLKVVGARPTTWRGTTYRGRRLDNRDTATPGSGQPATKVAKSHAAQAWDSRTNEPRA